MVALVYLVHRFWGGWFVWLDWEGVIIHDVLDVFFLSCTRSRASCMCSVCCRETLQQRICVGLAGWLELYGMIVSVKVDFLYMDIFHFIEILWIVTSK